MDALLDKMDAQFSELVSRISHLEKLEDQPSKIAALDSEFVEQVTYIKQQLEAGRELERLRNEGAQLDNAMNNILMELAQCRRDLEKYPDETEPQQNKKVSESDLLEYATKITKFTKKMPGADMNLLPWPAEDQLRRGMLATLTIQGEAGTNDMDIEQQHPAEETAMGGQQAENIPDQQQETQQQQTEQAQDQAKPAPAPRAKAAPKQKISLDFDSDDD